MSRNRHEMAERTADPTHMGCTMKNPCPVWQHHKSTLNNNTTHWKEWNKRDAVLGDGNSRDDGSDDRSTADVRGAKPETVVSSSQAQSAPRVAPTNQDILERLAEVEK